MIKKAKSEATGKVIQAVENLLYVEFDSPIFQGETGFIEVDKKHPLKAEVIEVKGGVAKMQVFEETGGVKWGTPAVFTGALLEAELGPGLLSSIYDGLQNPLEKLAAGYGNFLPRGVYIPALDHQRLWDFKPLAKEGDEMRRGGVLGIVREEMINHKIMVPFTLEKEAEVVWMASSGAYDVQTPIAKLKVGKETIEVTMAQRWPIKRPLVEGERVGPAEILETGCRVIDTQFPVLKGGTFCSPGPFGAGKTVLQHHLAKYSSADIVVICACGERAGEIVEVFKTFPHLEDHRTGQSLMKRTIIIGNTSSMPVAAREASVYMGMTIGEYYRQMGLNVLVLADSTSRWAQAMREMSGRLEEIPGDEAFPAYLASRIAAFYERAGVISLGGGLRGSLTLGATVSPAGGNFEEPVTQATLSVVGAFHGLSRSRSDARRYPAIDPLISWTKYLARTGQRMESKVKGWENKVHTASEMLQSADEIGRRMEVVGESGIAIEDMLIYLKGELYDFCYLQQNAFDPVDTYCPMERQVELFQLIWLIFELPCLFENKEQMRSFFLELQNEIRNLNYLEKGSDAYKKAKSEIEKYLSDKATTRTAQT